MERDKYLCFNNEPVIFLANLAYSYYSKVNIKVWKILQSLKIIIYSLFKQ